MNTPTLEEVNYKSVSDLIENCMSKTTANSDGSPNYARMAGGYEAIIFNLLFNADKKTVMKLHNIYTKCFQESNL
jgi:hypothetical protein